MKKSKIKCGKCNAVHEIVNYGCDMHECKCGALNITEKSKEYTLSEWLDFNYQEYLGAILSAIDKDEFAMLVANTDDDIKAGKFTSAQVETLRRVMDKGFSDQETIIEIADEINEQVRPKDLFQTKDGKLVLNKRGEKILRVSKAQRGIMIARTESTRLANLGAVEHFKSNGVTEVVWVATIGERTCPVCEALDGRIFEINESPRPPIHVYCRCTLINKV